MVVHSKADNTFSCRAGRQRGQRAGACATRPARRTRIWPGPDDIAHDGGHRMLAAHPAGQAARVPRRLPAVTLIVIAGCASSIRSSCPGSAAAGAGPRPVPARPRAGAGGAGPHRRPGSAADHRPATADAGALARGGVPARDGAAPSHAGSNSGGSAARRPRAHAPARRGRPGTSPVPGWTPDHRGRHFCGRRGAGPGKTFRPGRIRHGPSMYEMEGPCPASPRRLASCLVFAERRAPPAGARYPREGPVSRLLPRSRRRPRVVPVSSGESIIYCLPQAPRKSPAASHFLFFRYPRKAPQRAGSYPHSTAVIHGLFTAYPQVPECQPENTTTAGAECPVLCNQLAT